MNAEQRRLEEDRAGSKNWRKWGPYLSERQWGTVREDYSAGGNAWSSLSHDEARSRAYRWGEDGLAGISDDKSRLCLALALWNGRDPILKERLFGLTNSEGNHGEDVKELYYYLDATPTHSYLKFLYKYPQRAFPYERLVAENRRRGYLDREFELTDTGVFDDDRYFDVFVEYVKVSPRDILMLVTAHNRGPDAAPLHILPQFWFRNTWSWNADAALPRLLGADDCDGAIDAIHPEIGNYRLRSDTGPAELFTENDTNVRRLYGVDAPGPFKDAFHEYVVRGDRSAVNAQPVGSKAAFHYQFEVPAGGSVAVRLRLSLKEVAAPLDDFDVMLERRRREADEFYDDVQAGMDDPDARLVQRQAFAGMIWSKQFYCYRVPVWLAGDPTQPPPPESRRHGRNNDWPHLNNEDVISMPDKWEYPWYACWDLAFHCIALALIDPEFAKGQILLMTREWYMHPNGQLPAYEWNFSDVNPPVHAWAAWRVFELERRQRGGIGDVDFLKRAFHKLLLNFTWWVNRKDVEGRNLFQGGFLGLDNIGVFDRSAPLPTGGTLDQADGTAWMAMFSLNMLRISLELAQHDHAYEDLATKFFEHFLYIAEAMTNISGEGIGLWDDEDKFYYSVLRLPSKKSVFMKSRSMEGLIPMFAVEILDPELLERSPWFTSHMNWFMNDRPDLAALISRWQVPGKGQRHLLSLLRGHRMKRLLQRMLDETEFLSDHGVRALSKYHETHPYVFETDGSGGRLSVEYWPAESRSGMFGGNSNWRGPIWMPVNYLLYESLRRFHLYYDEDFKVECPAGSGTYMNLNEVALELCRRLGRLFLRGPDGRRPIFGDDRKFQEDPHFRDYVLFYEYFDGDNGRGLGASHQTGWSGLIAALLRPHETY